MIEFIDHVPEGRPTVDADMLRWFDLDPASIKAVPVVRVGVIGVNVDVVIPEQVDHLFPGPAQCVIVVDAGADHGAAGLMLNILELPDVDFEAIHAKEDPAPGHEISGQRRGQGILDDEVPPAIILDVPPVDILIVIPAIPPVSRIHFPTPAES